jgi:hypothetical protein
MATTTAAAWLSSSLAALVDHKRNVAIAARGNCWRLCWVVCESDTGEAEDECDSGKSHVESFLGRSGLISKMWVGISFFLRDVVCDLFV